MEDMERRLLGGRIRSIRARRGLTQKELAERAGLSESALRSYELGDRAPKGRHLDSIAMALGVRPEAFDGAGVSTEDQVIHLLFDLEEGFGLRPAAPGEQPGVTVDLTSAEARGSAIPKALRDWSRRREALDSGEITREEYLDWKDAYSPRIILDPITGEETDDPYTGRRLEGPEREGAPRDVRTMGWLNG